MWMKEGIIYSGDIYGAICSKKLYEHALHAGDYTIPKAATELLTKNDFVAPESISLNRLKGGRQINIMLLKETQLLKLCRKLVAHYSGNGLMLLSNCNGYLNSMIDYV